MNRFNTQMPYVASYILCFNSEGKIALLMRANTAYMNGYYGLPAGKTEKNETFTDGAIRESKEEIGVELDSSNLEYALTMHRYSTEDDGSNEQWVDVFFKVKKLNDEPYNAEPDVHSELIWVDPEELPEKIIPHHATGIRAYLDGVKYVEVGYDE